MAAAKKAKKELKKFGLTLELPASEPTAELLWIAADAEKSEFPLAEGTMLIYMLTELVGEEQAQQVRDKRLKVEQLAELVGAIQAEYGVDEGK